MPVKKNKKNNKKTKAASKKIKVVIKKKKVSKKKKKPQKIKKIRADKIEDLSQQLPEDKYIQALQQKEELEKERIRPVTIKAEPSKKKKYRGSKSFMWFLVIGVFLLILFGWLYSLQFTLNHNSTSTDHSWSSLTDTLTNSFTDFKKSMQDFKNNLQKIENANINTNYSKKNTNTLTDEQLKQMEDKVFPKLKNNLNK